MKRVLFIGVFVLLCVAYMEAREKEKFVLKGEIQHYDAKILYFFYGSPLDGLVYIDSTVVNDGKFVFEGEIEQPFLGGLSASAGATIAANMIILFIEPGNMELRASWDDKSNYTLVGSRSNDEMMLVAKQKQLLYVRLAPLVASKTDKEMSDEKRTELQTRINQLQQEIQKVDMDFITSHPSSFYSVAMLRNKVGDFSVEELKNYFNALDQNVRDSYDGRNILEYINTSKRLSPGKTAPEVTGKDIYDKEFRMSDLRGKYILLDFWASWCVPCRRSNPKLIEWYKKYHDKGLEVVCISSDDNIQKWREAVEKDAIGMFHHLLSGKKIKSDGSLDDRDDQSVKYNVKFLPTKFLIDPEGKIVGQFEETKLEEKLNEIFGF
ncbi:MAG: AhpC/TSA family protein [Bacteroidales bacterium]|nr:AhpC/TSA family protein [Bacteroidales bacterium]